MTLRRYLPVLDATLAKLSIRDILIVITAALTLLIALLSARALLADGERLSQTYALREAIGVSDRLLDAANAVAVERDLVLSSLEASDADTRASLAPALVEARRHSDAALGVALSGMAGSRARELAPLRAQLDIRRRALAAIRPRIDAALAGHPKDQTLRQDWNSAANGLGENVERLWSDYISPFTHIDAVATLHLRYRHMLRTITDYSGRERSIIGQIVSENSGATPEQTGELLRDQGELDLAWRTSRLLADQGGFYAEIASQYSDAESHYATLDGMVRELFYVPGAHRGGYPIGPDLWFELSSQAQESLSLLRTASQRATRGYLANLIAQTEHAIFWQIALALIALGLCAASFWIILARVIGPVNRIVGALSAAVRGEPAQFDRDRNRSDEIGELTRVLDAFQTSAERARALALERDRAARGLESEVAVRRAAEEKAQAQLERLGLLHRISRAIGERQDLNDIFDVVVANVEDQLPADFVCAFVKAPGGETLRIARLGAKSRARAEAMEMAPGAEVAIDANGLSRCMGGNLVYEPEFETSAFPFPRRLAAGGLKSFVAAPLQVESQVFGALVAARIEPEAFSSGECEFLRQLSEHVALAANQAELNAALQQAYDDLRQTQDAVMQQERLRALGQMASGVAHDINNALTPIALYTESLLTTEPALSSGGRAKLEVVQRAIDDAARTISRMSEFYRKRDRELALVAIDANILVRQVLELTQARWRDMAQSRGEAIEVKTELAAPAPSILGVESELREALTNLVLNAVDALPPGGGCITLRTASIEGATKVAIEVQDDGVGMDEETRQRCLEPFFTTKGERGTGLGLAMVYGAVQRHGGDLAIESAPGKGALVRLMFSAAGASAAISAEGEARPRGRLRLLIIDDDPILLRSLRDVLEGDGHVVVSATGGGDGLHAFNAGRSEGTRFDAVITDLGMPGMDGRRVAAGIKAAAETPVILLTGWGERLRAEEEVPPHIDCILSKPPKLRDMRAALAKLCGAEPTARTVRG